MPTLAVAMPSETAGLSLQQLGPVLVVAVASSLSHMRDMTGSLGGSGSGTPDSNTAPSFKGRARSLLALLKLRSRRLSTSLGDAYRSDINGQGPVVSLADSSTSSGASLRAGSSASNMTRNKFAHSLSVTAESGPTNPLFDLVPEYRDMDCRGDCEKTTSTAF